MCEFTNLDSVEIVAEWQSFCFKISLCMTVQLESSLSFVGSHYKQCAEWKILHYECRIGDFTIFCCTNNAAFIRLIMKWLFGTLEVVVRN